MFYKIAGLYSLKMYDVKHDMKESLRSCSRLKETKDTVIDYNDNSGLLLL
jgi:hypothetical protein